MALPKLAGAMQFPDKAIGRLVPLAKNPQESRMGGTADASEISLHGLLHQGFVRRKKRA